ncbi:MAG: ABC transporter permease [Rubrobacteridae bacterium]|nr:ABC transporter permease [Rubrobacteridae bacterium]
MKTLSISFKDLKIIVRDKRALLVLLVMPFVIITILGLALGGMWSGDSGISKFDVAYVDYDNGRISKELYKLVVSKDLKELLNVRRMKEPEAKQLVSNGDLAAAIIVPKDFSERILAGENANMQILADPGQEVRAGIVRSIAESFASHTSSIIIGTKIPVSNLAAKGMISQAQIAGVANDIVAQGQQMLANPQISVKKESAERNKDISALQYYSAAMAVMFILFGAMIGAFSLLEERSNMTLARLLTSPTGKLSILTGKLGGVFLIGVLQFAVLVLSTRAIFGVKWGNSIPGLIVLMLCTVLAATGMTIFIAAIVKTSKSAAAVSQIMIQSMAALGGSMMPIMIFPDWMQSVSRFTINYWGITGFRDLMLGRGFSSILTPCLALLAFFVFFMAIGVWRFKYE